MQPNMKLYGYGPYIIEDHELAEELSVITLAHIIREDRLSRNPSVLPCNFSLSPLLLSSLSLHCPHSPLPLACFLVQMTNFVGT